MLPEPVLREFYPDVGQVLAPLEDEEDFDYHLNEDKFVSFEEMHEMVERGETSNIIETRPTLFLLMG